MVILDADSLMTGKTLTQLVGLMDANPRAALIQAPAQLVGRIRCSRASSNSPPASMAPSTPRGWPSCRGRTAITGATTPSSGCMPSCSIADLPRLPGKPPFGGEIMSHDFIEAALLRRAGWDVWMAPDIGGSFEEPPPTLLDYLIRDRRWCQGNLQHLRIVFAQGLTLPSRLHLAMGIMSYVSSPLWLLLLIVSAIDMMNAVPPPPADTIALHPSLRCRSPMPPSW